MNKAGLACGRALLLTLAVVALATGCSKKLPQEVSDLNRVLGQAKDACASVYAASELAAVQGDVDSMNALVDEGKYRKARKSAIPLMSRIEGLQTAAQSGRAAALEDAEAAVTAAQAKIDASRSAEAATYAADEQRRAEAKLDEARSALADPCRYNDAARLAQEAGGLADAARTAAIAGKRSAEEEAARLAAEAERKRLEAEEARRREEEERLRAFPPSYTVTRGDSLWKIAGKDNIYKNSASWVLIYDANRDLISDPDLIFPGQELKIPRGMSEAEMTDKIRRLWRELAN